MSQSINIYWDTKVNLYRINTPYNAQFVDKFKALIPYQDRGWDAATRTWAFCEQYLTSVSELCNLVWIGCEIIVQTKAAVIAEERQYALPAQEFTKSQKDAIAFVENLDVEALGAAFKSRAKRLHPDAGGDGKAFAELNAAYQALRAILK